MIAWLIEFKGAVPYPVYVPEEFRRGCFTLDAWAARRFQTKEDAEAWMRDPICGSTHCVSFDSPWAAVDHGFDIKCAYCEGDPGFVLRGEWGCCDGCMPF